MSAPQTDPERQVRHHRTPIIAMLLILLVVLAGFLWWFADETGDPEMPGATPVEEIAGTPPPATPAPQPEQAPAPAQ